MSRFKSSQVHQTLGLHVGVLPSTSNYTNIREFEGLAMPIIVHEGTRELNELLRSGAKDRVVIVDGSHFGRTAVVGRQEVVSAVAGGCKALVVLGLVTHLAAIEMARIPVLAFAATPRVPSAETGLAKPGLIDIDGGHVSAMHYIVGDADGVVAVEKERYQQRFSIK
ncbi:hypothetical protein AB6806_18635 [Bosea sp. RCC_152_1]|uniref:RraA family protein n=1 Tax=Bosea sp. RCC_152_1 TaxID=3239228 RepID=UPI00352696D8